MKKWISYTIDGILIAFIGVLAYTQISMALTKNKNHGVPSAFGVSFLYVQTGSMDDSDQPNPKGIPQGSGIIIKKVGVGDLTPSTPIYEYVTEKEIVDGVEVDKKDENGDLVYTLDSNGEKIKVLDENNEPKIIDFEKDGSVVTFEWVFKDYSGKTLGTAPDTHRVIDKEYDESEKKWYVVTMGDQQQIHDNFRKGLRDENTVQRWSEDKLIGKVVYHSIPFGEILTLTSPAIAAGAGKNAWLFPIGIIAPIVIIAAMSIIDAFVKYHKEEKEYEAKIQADMIAAGIDMEDEAAVELFRMKAELKLEYQEELEAEKKKIQASIEKEKAKARKQLEKEKDRIRKEILKEQKKDEK